MIRVEIAIWSDESILETPDGPELYIQRYAITPDRLHVVEDRRTGELALIPNPPPSSRRWRYRPGQHPTGGGWTWERWLEIVEADNDWHTWPKPDPVEPEPEPEP